MNLANLKIGTRLGLGFSCVLGLLALITAIAIWRLQTVGDLTTYMVKQAMTKERLMAEWHGATRLNGARTLANITSSDAADVQQLEAQIKNTSERISELQKQLDIMDKDSIETALYADVGKKRSDYRAMRDAVFNEKKAGKDDDAKKLAHSSLEPALESYLSSIQKLTDHQTSVINDLSGDVETQYRTGQVLLAILGGCALLIGIGFSYGMARSITRPLNQALQVAQTVASGDLTSHIEVRSTDEAGQLLHALKNMNSSLQHIVARVRAGTDTIATASNQIASGNLDLSSRTEQQASSLEETASSMDELTSTVKQNADNARQANQLAASASDVAVKGGAVVAQVVDTMGAINESAKKIVDIIGVIDGIAFQTNILALNAAVEAARAGEQGRGFAVVASEVRNLAQRSAAAAKEIKALIGDSVEKVDTGAKLVDQAGATMQEIVDSVKRVTSIMSEISVASQEQTNGIGQINHAITAMDDVTQQNASLVEEAAAAASALQEQAANLASVVSVFKLDATFASVAVPPNAAGSPAIAGRAHAVPIAPTKGQSRQLGMNVRRLEKV